MSLTVAVILGAVALFGSVAVVVAILYYDDLIEWFKLRNEIKEADKDNIAFTIKEEMKNGNVKVIQGIFNSRTEKIADGKVTEARQVDPQLERVHAGNKLVLYQ